KRVDRISPIVILGSAAGAVFVFGTSIRGPMEAESCGGLERFEPRRVFSGKQEHGRRGLPVPGELHRDKMIAEETGTMAGRPACLSWAVVVGAVVAPHLEAQTTELISLSETFEQANRSCREPSLS